MRIHWFAFTFFGDHKEFDALYKEFLAPIFGDYVGNEHGGRGYRSTATANCGVRLYFDPVSVGPKGNHCHVELPGEACDCIIPDIFREIMTYFVFSRLENGQPQTDKFSIKRIDIAYDHDFFTPEQWLQAISGENVVTLAKRDQISKKQSPFAIRENGQKGTTTVYLGSNESERMLRVYDKRGPTRVELQMRGNRAHLVAIDILLRHPSKWHEAGMSHIVQYVTFTEGQAPAWWLDFIGSSQSADLIISSSRVVSLQKLNGWINRQVAPALSVLMDVEGIEYITELLIAAKERDRSRYASILQMVQGENKE